jgi:CheY-specific phosphatase CheX
MDNLEQTALVDSFIAAARDALSAMASADVAVEAVRRTPLAPSLGAISVQLTVSSVEELELQFIFPAATATAFARRILGGVATQPDLALVQDCMAEIVNVIAGQAKAMLADSANRFTYSIPKVLSGAAGNAAACLAIAFVSDLGAFGVQLS